MFCFAADLSQPNDHYDIKLITGGAKNIQFSTAPWQLDNLPTHDPRTAHVDTHQINSWAHQINS